MTVDKKNPIKGLFLFIGGVIVTITLTKAGDIIYPTPSEPLVIGKVQDTIYVYNLSSKDITNNFNNPENELQFWKERDDANEELIKRLQSEYKNDIKEIKSVILGSENITKNITGQIKKTMPLDYGYNQIISNPKKYFPKLGGYQFKGNHNQLEMSCPNFKSPKEYLDIEFTIQDSSILSNIALIHVTNSKITSSTGSMNQYNYYLLPQLGVNRIRVKNIKSEGKYALTLGALLKDDKNKMYPGLYGIQCRINN